MDVIEVIKSERAKRGMSMQALSRASGVAASTIQRIETGRLTPTVVTAKQLLAALGKQLAVVDRRPSDALREHRVEALQMLRDSGADHVRVFGSVARGTDTGASDIDLLCDFPSGIGWELFELQDELTTLLGFDVDIVSDSGSSEVISRARAEAVPL